MARNRIIISQKWIALHGVLWLSALKENPFCSCLVFALSPPSSPIYELQCWRRFFLLLYVAQCRFESHLPTQPHQLITFRPLPPLLAFSSSRAFKDDWHWRGRGTSSCRRIYFRTPSHPSIESNADKREREKGFKMLDVGRRRRGGRTPTRNRQIDESTVVTGKILCRMFFSPTWVHNISSSSLRLRCWLSICSLRYQGERYERQS